ncbi:MAG: flagellar type III secretion system pore protein FliP [Ignavibacteriales bacterium]|nr:flagellar type III secretion system pore protein FliP [Ignavibacteriales bacterium]
MRKLFFILLVIAAFSSVLVAQDKSLPFPKIGIDIGKATKPEDVSVTLQILFFMTILSLAPALFILTTCFTRIVIVLHFLKQAIGLQQVPPAQVLVGLAMFLTFFIMAPTWNEVNTKGLQPYLKEQITMEEAYNRGVEPIRLFMFKYTREEDLEFFSKISEINKPNNRDQVPTYVLIPAFAMSEMRVGFQIGFLLFIPFLIIDLVITSILMSMGMMMLPPIIISLPFKLLLFVLVDGWSLVIQSVVKSFQ